jgi:phosphoenolpyruvate synthase/pyruvate phosphate dikinase
VEFGVTEYTVVFRRALRQRNGQRATRAVWTVVRPFTRAGAEGMAGLAELTELTDASASVAQVFVVPICSTLALDTRAYEKFLVQSGALNRALRALNGLTFAQPQTAENARKQIQSIVMAAEVNHIVRKMSA